MPLRLLKGIRHFKNNHFKEKEELFTALKTGQAPDVLFIGCIDSRVDLRSVTNANPGEMLVARNPGNIVTPHSLTATSAEAASIEFSLNHLKNVEEIIICGHSHCGAMTGLITPGIEKDLPSTAAWLSHAKRAFDQLEHHHPDLLNNPSMRLKYLTQDNILLQIEHLKTHPSVAQRLQEGKLKIHGWYYEFERGEIYIYNTSQNRFVSFEETVKEIAQRKLNQIVEDAALNYLENLTPVNHGDHHSILQHFNRKNPVEPIWKAIKTKVRSKAQEELGDLYLTSRGDFSPDFNKLLKSGLNVRVRNTYNKYQQIEGLFNQILEAQSNPLLNDEKKTLLTAVAALKKHTLYRFASQDKAFDFDRCLLLATSTKELTNKLINSKANLADIETFKQANKHVQNTSSIDPILKTILATIAAMATGLVVGLLLAGVSGAAVGAITGSVGAALTIGLWAQKKNPAHRVTNAAEQLIHNKTEDSGTEDPTSKHNLTPEPIVL